MTQIGKSELQSQWKVTYGVGQNFRGTSPLAIFFFFLQIRKSLEPRKFFSGEKSLFPHNLLTIFMVYGIWYMVFFIN